jgi:hypothetical protein
MDQKDIEEFKRVTQMARSYPEECLKLPLPRRFEFEAFQKTLELVTGNALVVIDQLVKEGLPAAHVSRILNEDSTYYQTFKLMGITRQQIDQLVQMRRFYAAKAPIFTFRESLCRRMDDVEIGDSVTAEFFRPPHETCYFEFGRAEERGNLPYTVFANKRYSLLEGCYISFFESVDQSVLSQYARELMEIDPKAPLRCLEIYLCASPSAEGESNRTVLNDQGAYFSLMWTDDSLSIHELLRRQVKLVTETQPDSDVEEKMAQSFHNNLDLVATCLLYLTSQHRKEINELTLTDLKIQAKNLKSPAKLKKVQRKLQKAYDRIVIGPDQDYVPLAESLKRIEGRSGVRPHIRRPHWAIRRHGEGRAKKRLTFIPMAFVNASELNDKDRAALTSDYDVR